MIPWTAAYQDSLPNHLLELVQTHFHWVGVNGRWCPPTFSSCIKSLPVSGSFPMNQLFASGGQRTGPSVLAPVLPMNQFSSVQFSHSVVSNSLPPHGLQHARALCPSLTPRAYSNSCPLSQWCHPTAVVPFSSCLQSFPASRSFPVSQFFASGGQSIGVSASTSVLPMNIQDRFPLGLAGWISLQSKGLSRVSSSTTVLKHQSFGAHSAFFMVNSHIWLLEKT